MVDRVESFFEVYKTSIESVICLKGELQLKYRVNLADSYYFLQTSKNCKVVPMHLCSVSNSQ